MEYIFSGCKSLNELDLTSFNIKKKERSFFNVNHFSTIFKDCSDELNLKIKVKTFKDFQ